MHPVVAEHTGPEKAGAADGSTLDNLSPLQCDVLVRLASQWLAYQTAAFGVRIAGNVVCSRETLAVLARRRLVRRIGGGAWSVTESGLSAAASIRGRHASRYFC